MSVDEWLKKPIMVDPISSIKILDAEEQNEEEGCLIKRKKGVKISVNEGLLKGKPKNSWETYLMRSSRWY
ncbi:Hypothetical predicted protein [Olea europaea subsp. europaea]|uniref:Uncharacterized protein n=1 Tax=Olea europaea subsp. europaea TaxID=158383 RepID=A0A8S0PR78_OLEEU|nr:Hypothetical predicted protein [Olea europaea subsp. europaea]